MSGDQWLTRFLVEKIYKGSLPETIEIIHHTQGPACGYIPIFFSSEFVIAELADGVYRTSSCQYDILPEEAVKSYLETGQDVSLPNRFSCY